MRVVSTERALLYPSGAPDCEVAASVFLRGEGVSRAPCFSALKAVSDYFFRRRFLYIVERKGSWRGCGREGPWLVLRCSRSPFWDSNA